jgi:hypothetical protein
MLLKARIRDILAAANDGLGGGQALQFGTQMECPI